MSSLFRGSSGTYRVKDIESIVYRTPKQNSPMKATTPATVHFLDGETHTFHIDKHAKGQFLIELVCDHLDLVERDYFGLQFLETEYEIAQDLIIWRWVEPCKSLKKQLKGGSPYALYFRVKFYVSDPCLLHDEFTRYTYFLQLKKDIQEGKLSVPQSMAPLLASYVVQSELGDFDPEEHKLGYLSDFKFVPNQGPDFDVKVHELHKQHRGETPADAEYNFLDHCKRLDTYGISLYHAQDANGVDIQLGVTYNGFVVFQNALRLSVFPWTKIIKISFKQKQFFIQIHEETKDYDTLLGFYMLSIRTCKYLWKSCVEHHSFFRMNSTRPLVSRKLSLLSWGSKLRGRTEYKTLEEGTRRYRNDKPNITRSPSKRYRRTIAGSSRNEILQDKSAPIVHESERNGLPASQSLQNSVVRNNNNVTIVHVGSQPQQTNNGHLHLNGGVNANGTVRHSNKGFHNNSTTSILPTQPSFVNHSIKRSSPSSSGDGIRIDDDGGFREAPALYARSSSSTAPAKHASNASNHVRLDAGENANPYPVNGLSYRAMPERIPVPDTALMTSPVHLVSYSNVARPRKELVLPSDSNGNGLSSSLTCIRIKPDSDGKFGFNVRGGIDLNLPVIVTRVAPNTPADLAVPRLHEGDQVLSINGRDTATLTHDEVVILIKSSRDTRCGELVLYVRPNIYNGGDEQEPEFQYIPDTPKALNGHSGNPLQESILLLSDGLKTNNAMLHFEQLYRKNPKMSMKDAEISINTPRNRYKDVLPYDATRVLLQRNESGSDYINANFVKMEIPTSGIVNRYIAAQGPLPHTSCDFWQMIWEQQSTLVVMLTSLVEQGRIKCHQYWPNLYETFEYGPLQVTCMKEQVQDCFAFRELSLIHTESNEERHITHMQYIAWPDHGVPDDASDFLEFVIRVRQHRVGMGEPTVIHCSAGIGRTGVLILMETAMCLIEANEPVYPLDIVRTMRDQRAMLIQTTSQYKFVCEAILRVYNDGLVKPLDDYRK